MSVSATFEELVQIVTTRSVMIGGKAIPLATLFALLRNIPAIGAAFEKNQSVIDAFKAIEPELLPVVEQLANAFFPGSGGAIELVALLLAKSHSMTPEEEKLWMDRQTSEH
jgi:hypothetical protein